MTLALTAAALAIAAVVPWPESIDAGAAFVDRQRLPATEGVQAIYVSYATADRIDRENLRIATRLMVASSSRQIVVERLQPVAVTSTLDRWDRRALGWSDAQWGAVVADYPYDRYDQGKPPAIVRADWLLTELADASKSEAYYRLLLGVVPKTRDDWLRQLRVTKDGDPLHRYGMIEGDSGVAKQRTRWLESFPADRGYAWGTRDSLRTGAANDPLEHPLGDFAHDGEEWIVGIPKVVLATGERGVLQVYLLSDGAGNRVDAAPVALVEDSTRFRGLAEIRNPGSCVQCHDEGLRQPTRNELREYVASGAELYTARPEDRDRLEAFHFARLAKDIDRANEDFGVIVRHVTGVSGPDAAAAFRLAVQRYDAPLTLGDAARELGKSPSAVQNAIASQTGLGKPLGARAAALTAGGTITREAFAQQWATFRKYLLAWEKP